MHDHTQPSKARMTQALDRRSRPPDKGWEEAIGKRVSPQPDGCWQWIGQINNKGYATYNPAKGERVAVHRWLYERMVDRIPDGFVLHHTCRNRGCVNPAHLEPMTSSDHGRLHRGAG
jgi:hypothetical protein